MAILPTAFKHWQKDYPFHFLTKFDKTFCDTKINCSVIFSSHKLFLNISMKTFLLSEVSARSKSALTFVGERKYTFSSWEKNGQKLNPSICRRLPCNSCMTSGYRVMLEGVWPWAEGGSLAVQTPDLSCSLCHASLAAGIWFSSSASLCSYTERVKINLQCSGASPECAVRKLLWCSAVQ